MITSCIDTTQRLVLYPLVGKMAPTHLSGFIVLTLNMTHTLVLSDINLVFIYLDCEKSTTSSRAPPALDYWWYFFRTAKGWVLRSALLPLLLLLLVEVQLVERLVRDHDLLEIQRK